MGFGMPFFVMAFLNGGPPEVSTEQKPNITGIFRGNCSSIGLDFPQPSFDQYFCQQLHPIS